MRNTLIKRAIVVAVAGAATLFVLPAAPANALYPCLADHYCAHYWYTDSSQTVLKGFYTDNTECGGGTLSSGIRQGYLVFGQWPCGGWV